jgi:hypothetical protein
VGKGTAEDMVEKPFGLAARLPEFQLAQERGVVRDGLGESLSHPLLDIVLGANLHLVVGKVFGDLAKDCTDIVLDHLSGFRSVQRLTEWPEFISDVPDDVLDASELKLFNADIEAEVEFILGNGGATVVEKSVAMVNSVAVGCSRRVRLKPPVRNKTVTTWTMPSTYRLGRGNRGGAVSINVAVDDRLDRNLSLHLVSSRLTHLEAELSAHRAPSGRHVVRLFWRLVCLGGWSLGELGLGGC